MAKFFFLLGCVVFSAQAMAVDVMKLVERKGCFNCHSIHAEGIGPAWREVARKYQGQEQAGKALVVSILYGSRGRWGERPMRGQAKKIDKKQAELIAEFILDIR